MHTHCTFRSSRLEEGTDPYARFNKSTLFVLKPSEGCVTCDLIALQTQSKTETLCLLIHYTSHVYKDGGLKETGAPPPPHLCCFHALSMATFDRGAQQPAVGRRRPVIEGLLWPHESRQQPYLKSSSGILILLRVNSSACLAKQRQ